MEEANLDYSDCVSSLHFPLQCTEGWGHGVLFKAPCGCGVDLLGLPLCQPLSPLGRSGNQAAILSGPLPSMTSHC